jgi:hypothetical protein
VRRVPRSAQSRPQLGSPARHRPRTSGLARTRALGGAARLPELLRHGRWFGCPLESGGVSGSDMAALHRVRHASIRCRRCQGKGTASAYRWRGPREAARRVRRAKREVPRHTARVRGRGTEESREGHRWAAILGRQGRTGQPNPYRIPRIREVRHAIPLLRRIAALPSRADSHDIADGNDPARPGPDGSSTRQPSADVLLQVITEQNPLAR